MLLQLPRRCDVRDNRDCARREECVDKVQEARAAIDIENAPAVTRKEVSKGDFARREHVRVSDFNRTQPREQSTRRCLQHEHEEAGGEHAAILEHPFVPREERRLPVAALLALQQRVRSRDKVREQQQCARFQRDQAQIRSETLSKEGTFFWRDD